MSTGIFARSSGELGQEDRVLQCVNSGPIYDLSRRKLCCSSPPSRELRPR
ncbi:hypothetical protein TIFTF001_013898 [Ficus carica]|uniref:Uncharacterized protein n=1 Tax=Ficus carica TaxID=3494 RepID=A0AA87ZYK9_FICCA|nr:hypothetical protein TIFTF001_013898 [Ficus carica]